MNVIFFLVMRVICFNKCFMLIWMYLICAWSNDEYPNAPFFYKGYYHLFYQYNPFSAVWGLIRWGHAVSRDLINWEHLPGAALYPDEWYDINGAWSGSATKMQEGGAPVILYTGNTNVSVQVTNMAVPKDPSDPLLREWKKVPENPIMMPEGIINSSSFRDPTTAWLGSDDIWRVLVGNKRDKQKRGMALLYKSKDFKKWVKAKHPLHSAKHFGMWECPDFYPVSLHGNDDLDASVEGPFLKHVLKNSLDDSKVDYYTVGKYFPKLERYVPDNGSVEGPNGLRYDYGKFYASKTFYDDNKGRRILWGWINESDSVADSFTLHCLYSMINFRFLF
ncbi:beta-fructofuranosidase, insoluble isoenzyme CWINV2-like [Cryptomeria japonica]|uniref:beta-fructofuranosidase, insoluble isoenzyme CWINV2-like n=1 Tax=Cryptomeria japonica TaxID=3369 RepID=UPI0027DAB490|nr:beta-fructofuranosidase, insoluble isoenzyme CWINV2-like [Cryptomeria japonica]